MAHSTSTSTDQGVTKLCDQWSNSLAILSAGNAGGPRAQGPKTVKGAQSDPNYVSRLGLGPVANVCRGPKNIDTPPTVCDGGVKAGWLIPVADYKRA